MEDLTPTIVDELNRVSKSHGGFLARLRAKKVIELATALSQGAHDLSDEELAGRLKFAVSEAISDPHWQAAINQYMGFADEPDTRKQARHERAGDILKGAGWVSSKHDIRRRRGYPESLLEIQFRALAEWIQKSDREYPRKVDPPTNGPCTPQRWSQIARFALNSDAITVVGVMPIPLARLLHESAFEGGDSADNRLRQIEYFTSSFDTVSRLSDIVDGPMIYTRWTEGVIGLVHSMRGKKSDVATERQRVDIKVFGKRLLSCMIYYYDTNRVLTGVSILVHTPMQASLDGQGKDEFVHAWITEGRDEMLALMDGIAAESEHFDLRYVLAPAPEKSSPVGSVSAGRAVEISSMKVDREVGADDLVPVASLFVVVESRQGPKLVLFNRVLGPERETVAGWGVPSSRLQEVDFVARTQSPFRGKRPDVRLDADASELLVDHYWHALRKPRPFTLDPELFESAAKRALMHRCGVHTSSVQGDIKSHGSFLLAREGKPAIGFWVHSLHLSAEEAKPILLNANSVSLVSVEDFAARLEAGDPCWENNSLLSDGSEWLQKHVVPKLLSTPRGKPSRKTVAR